MVEVVRSGSGDAASASREDGHDAVQCATARAPSPHLLRTQSNRKSEIANSTTTNYRSQPSTHNAQLIQSQIVNRKFYKNLCDLCEVSALFALKSFRGCSLPTLNPQPTTLNSRNRKSQIVNPTNAFALFALKSSQRRSGFLTAFIEGWRHYRVKRKGFRFPLFRVFRVGNILRVLGNRKKDQYSGLKV